MLLSIVIPVFNEAQGIAGLLARLYPIVEQLDCDYEMIFVDDGSSDGSLDALRLAARLRACTMRRSPGPFM